MWTIHKSEIEPPTFQPNICPTLVTTCKTAQLKVLFILPRTFLRPEEFYLHFECRNQGLYFCSCSPRCSYEKCKTWIYFLTLGLLSTIQSKTAISLDVEEEQTCHVILDKKNESFVLNPDFLSPPITVRRGRRYAWSTSKDVEVLCAGLPNPNTSILPAPTTQSLLRIDQSHWLCF